MKRDRSRTQKVTIRNRGVLLGITAIAFFLSVAATSDRFSLGESPRDIAYGIYFSLHDPIANTWPTNWPRQDPSDLGIDRRQLDAFTQSVGKTSSGCIARDGALIHCWGNPRLNGDWGSATKAFYLLFLLFAVQEGLIQSADVHISDYVDGLRDADRTITFRQLANMTSGYSLPEGPGEAWAYSDLSSRLLRRAVVEKALGLPVDDAKLAEAWLLADNRLGPLQFEDGDMFRVTNGAIRLNMSPRDNARIGQLWLDKGIWDDRVVLNAEIFDDFFRMDVPAGLPISTGTGIDDYLDMSAPSADANPNNKYPIGPGFYGHFLWFNTNGRLWPDIPSDAFQANGHRNRAALTMIPSKRLVVSWLRGNEIQGPNDASTFHTRMNRSLALLVEALP